MGAITLTTPAQLGAVVRGARTRAGLTQVDLANRAGVSRRWIIMLESGHGARAELGKILDTLDALGLTIAAVQSDPAEALQHAELLEGL